MSTMLVSLDCFECPHTFSSFDFVQEESVSVQYETRLSICHRLFHDCSGSCTSGASHIPILQTDICWPVDRLVSFRSAILAMSGANIRTPVQCRLLISFFAFARSFSRRTSLRLNTFSDVSPCTELFMSL